MKHVDLNPHEAFERFPDSDLAGAAFGLALEGKIQSWEEIEQKASLFVAVEHGDIERIHRLVAKGVSANERRNGESLLYFALYRGRADSCAALLKAGADPNLDKAFPPLLHAAQGDLETTRLLLDYGADVNAGNGGALLNACGRGQSQIVELLLSRGANIEATTSVWLTKKREIKRVRSLMIAAWEGHISVVNQLIKAKAKQTAKDSEGSTAADWAKRCRERAAQQKILELLLDS